MLGKWKIAVIVSSLLLAGGSFNAFAHGGGGGGGGPSGGMSAGHLSAQGMRNTNGPNAFDRDKGLARAEDRRSIEGARHEQAMHKVGHGHFAHHHHHHHRHHPTTHRL